MAPRITFALLAICIIHFAACAPPPEATVSPLEAIQKTATDFFNGVNTHFNSLVGAKDHEEAKKVYQETTDDLVSKVSEISNNLKEQFKGVDEQVKSSFQKVSSDLDVAVNNLKGKNSELSSAAGEVGSSLKEGVQNLVQETQKAAQTLAKNTEGLDTAVANNLKKLFGEVVTVLQSTSSRLHETASKQ